MTAAEVYFVQPEDKDKTGGFYRHVQTCSKMVFTDNKCLSYFKSYLQFLTSNLQPLKKKPLGH